ncbi:peptidase [Fibrella sp. HMF5405]|uniref:Peptidase n=1 Tax=Fibrella forsythiae TaxID=2817061 RepID=A0ABS3JSP4_9BACT|nr:peptidase [Fibrella forsythiae]
MRRDVYQTICFSLSLTLAVSLFQSWLHFQLRTELYSLPSFPSWFLIVNPIALITSILLLTYYQYKAYRVTFLTGVVATLTTFGSLLYLVLARLYPSLGQHPDTVIFLGVMTNLTYALSLWVSRASERLWLKRTGIALFFIYLGHLATLVWFVNTPPYPPNATLDLIRQWLSLADRVIPVLLLVNFMDEYRQVSPGSERTASSNKWLLAKGILALLAVCSLVVGLQLVGENYGQTHLSNKEITLAQPFDEGHYVNSQGDTLFYRLLKPLDYNPQKKYPLVVGLPFSCRSDNTRQIEACPISAWLATQENRRNYPAFVFVPRCPPYTGWGGVANTPSVAPLAIEAIVALDNLYSIDPRRRYVSGVSRGGYGSWHMIGAHPELFAAAIPVCGEGDPAQASKMTSVSVWAFHGAKDKNVPVSGSRDMIAALRKMGASPQYTEYPDAAHSIWEEVVKTPGLLDWLFAQKQGNPPQNSKS